MTRKEIKIIALSASGQIIEFYDFLIFVLLANVISAHFFVGSIYARFMYLFAVFALGYFVRPLGGIIFGHCGDRRGRKKTFISTILIISVATFCMGLIPSYETIGITAPIIFIILRIIQGFSLGGELPGAISFVHEYMPDNKKTFGISFIFSSVQIGLLLASVVATVLFIVFSHIQMVSFGWRISFFIGGILGLVLCILRGRMSDTPVFEKLLKHNQILKYPIAQLLKNNLRNCILGMVVFLSVTYGTLFSVAIPGLLSSFIPYYKHVHILEINTWSIVLMAICVITFAYIIDRLRLNIYLFFSLSSFVIAIIIYPLFIMINMHSYVYLIWVYIIFAITVSLLYAVLYHILAKLFPPTVKYSGLALVINISIIFSSGTVPLMTNSLLNLGGIALLSFSIMAIMILTAIAGLILYFWPPDYKKLKEWDDETRELYNLDKQLENNNLTFEEEKIIIQKIEIFSDRIINSDEDFKDIPPIVKIDETSIKYELSQLNIEDVAGLSSEEKQELHKCCKYILRARFNDSSTVLKKYKKLLKKNCGNKFYTYFYTRCLWLKCYRTNKSIQTVKFYQS
jgi:MFS family permease